MSNDPNEEKIGSYKILHKIGEGGMAEIYKAMQPALKRNVVIKKLKDPNREIIARFKKEALLSASFTQENVIAIYDFIYTNRAYYLIMEHVDGEDLRTIIDHVSPLPVNIAVMIALDIARGLEYTHNQSIIHRDIKPSNILISYDGSVKLIDFGIAKDETSTRLTLTGLIVGTPSYMSPEQAHGDALSPQSDLYALGILLYEMLTGIKPFYGSNNTEILAKVIRSKYVPAHRINPEIPMRLRRIMKILLKKDRRKRYKNAAGLIHDLEKAVPWQIRSHKKNIIAAFLQKLNKNTVTSTEDTIKAALLERSSSWGWYAIRYSIVAALLICGFAVYKQFRTKELGYIKLENPVREMELRINNHSYPPLHISQKIVGPFLQGAQILEASDPINNATYITQTLVEPNDTTNVKVDLQYNPGSSNIQISTIPLQSEISIDGVKMNANRKENIQLKPGWHEITIEKAGFQPVKDRRFLRAAETYVMEYNLKAN